MISFHPVNPPADIPYPLIPILTSKPQNSYTLLFISLMILSLFPLYSVDVKSTPKANVALSTQKRKKIQN
jgi:hypothetical protein